MRVADLHGHAYNRENSHQRLMERMVFFVNGGTGVAQAQPENSASAHRSPDCVPLSDITATHPGQPDSARPWIGRPSRRKTVVLLWVTAKESRTNQRRSRNDARGFSDRSHTSTSWRALVNCSLEKGFQKVDPNSTADQLLERLKLGSNRIRFDTLLVQP